MSAVGSGVMSVVVCGDSLLSFLVERGGRTPLQTYVLFLGKLGAGREFF